MSLFMKTIANPFMKTILRTPLHPLMSKSIAVVTVTGRKTGKKYSLPVNYLLDGDIVWIISMRDRNWWKNLRGGARVSLLLMGTNFMGLGEVYESPKDVEGNLKDYLLLKPDYAQYFDVGLDEAGEFMSEDLTAAAEKRVMVRVDLS